MTNNFKRYGDIDSNEPPAEILRLRHVKALLVGGIKGPRNENSTSNFLYLVDLPKRYQDQLHDSRKAYEGDIEAGGDRRDLPEELFSSFSRTSKVPMFEDCDGATSGTLPRKPLKRRQKVDERPFINIAERGISIAPLG